jgi:hypothetical protein
MDLMRLVAAVPPLLVWFGLWMYLKNIDKKLSEAEGRL